MATDKTIPQLTPGTPQLSDLLVGDNGIISYKFTETQLLALLQANLSTGAVITFGTGAVPSTGGANGDLYWKTNTGQIAQKLSGTWTVVYTIVQGVIGSTIYYGSTVPGSGVGINGDTYLRTSNGTFYEKIAGAWVAQFSMATGPTGPAGANGTDGTDGTNGTGILNGTTNPSNTLGVDGDFYINTSTNNFFGPKGVVTPGVWPAGVALTFGQPGNIVTPIVSGVTANPLTVTYSTTLYPSAKYELLRADNSYDNNTKVQKIANPVSGSPVFIVTGDDDGTGHFVDSMTFSILP